MNKFIHPPDSPAGCILWLSLLAGATALLFEALSRIAG